MKKIDPKKYSSLLHLKILENVNKHMTYNIRLKIYCQLYEKVFDLMDEIEFLTRSIL